MQQALARGSSDNVTVQLVRVEGLALPSPLRPRMSFEGDLIVCELHVSPRCPVFLAPDDASSRQVVLKTPSVGLRENANHLDRFLLEESVARRGDSPHGLRAFITDRLGQHLFVTMDYIEGQTLGQWMTDHPKPIVLQVAKGLQALHRKGMLHQDYGWPM